MSQENVEVIRRLLPGPDVDIAQALRDDDLWAVASKAWAAVVHPCFECVLDWQAQRSTYVGVDGIREAWLEWVGPWERYSTEIEELLDAGDRVAMRQIWHGAGYGPEANLEMTNVITVRKGRVVYQEFVWDHAEALEAVGLSE